MRVSTTRDLHQLAEQLFAPRSCPRSWNLRMRVQLVRPHVTFVSLDSRIPTQTRRDLGVRE